jgi:hypothetical protein
VQLLALLTPAIKECRLVSLCSIAYARQIEIVPATFISTLCESRLPFPKTTTATRRPKPIPQFSPNATLDTMRERTGKVSEDAVRRAAAKMKKPQMVTYGVRDYAWDHLDPALPKFGKMPPM